MKNLAVILDVTYGGYSIAKALSRHHIPMIGFCSEEESEYPEAKTKLADISIYSSKDYLLSCLLEVADKQKLPPVLFLTSDRQVEFFNNNRKVLEKLFLINFPSNNNIKTLFKKDDFQRQALLNNWKTPESQILNSKHDIKKVRYPCFVKPIVNWKTSYKGQMCYTAQDIEQMFLQTDQFVAQQYIPGPTENIIAVYVYCDNGHCEVAVPTKKVREWPLENGTGCCLQIINDQEAQTVAYNFFSSVRYKGFGSLEMKRSIEDNNLYLIEATVGRVDANSEILTVNGINLPLYHYFLLTKNQKRDDLLKQRKFPIYWIYESMDIYSSFFSIRRRSLNVFKTIWTYLTGNFHLFNLRDPSPFRTFFRRNILKLK